MADDSEVDPPAEILLGGIHEATKFLDLHFIRKIQIRISIYGFKFR